MSNIESVKYHVKKLMLRKLLSLVSEGFNNAEDLMFRSGLENSDFESLMEILEGIQESGPYEGTSCIRSVVDDEEKIVFRLTDTGEYVLNNNTFHSLRGFEDLSVFEKEIDILVNQDPLEFLVKTAGKIHVGDKFLVALNICIGLTPWFETDTLHFYPVGKSGGGKSSLCSKILHLFPKSFVEVISSSSPKALYYAWLSGSLNMNKIIFLDDIQAGMDFIDVIKAFTSASIVKPRHWTLDAHRKFLDIKPDKMYSIWLTSVNPINDDQLKNRFIMGNIDDSDEQDKMVNEHVKKMYRNGLEKKVARDPSFKLAKNILNIVLSESANVIIPYDITFPIMFDRRSLPFFLILIKSSAFLNKFKREKIGNKILASFADFEVARMLWESIIEYQSAKVSKDSISLLNLLPENEEEAMTRSEIATKLKVSTKTIERRARELMMLDLIYANQRTNRIWYYWKNADMCRRRLGQKKITIVSDTKDKLYQEINSMGIRDTVYSQMQRSKDSTGKRITNENIIKNRTEAKINLMIENIMNNNTSLIKYLMKFVKKKPKQQQTVSKVLTADKIKKLKETGEECNAQELKSKYNFTDYEIEKLISQGMLFEIRPGILKAV